MMMDPITPATTPPLSSPVEPTSCLGRNRSLTSIRSVFTLSVCSASDKIHPSSTACCPHCSEAVTVSDPAGVLPKNAPTDGSTNGELTPLEAPSTPTKGNLKLQTGGPSFDPVVVPDISSATASLLRTLQDTNNELQTHCRDLNQIRLMSPSPAPSRRGSIHSIHPLKPEAVITAPASFPTSADDNAIPKSNQTLQPQGNGFQSGHPLICDLGDLVNLSNANFRLLKTLQDKVNKVDLAEKMLRTEREAIERERKQLKQMSAEVEKERVRLMAGGLGYSNYKLDTTHNQSSVPVSRSRSGGVTPDGAWDEAAEVAVFDEEWTEEKEQYLAKLENKLKKANRQWSDEQEEILGPLERLREEKRQEEKARRLERQTSNKFERVNSEELEKAPRKKSDCGGKSSPRSSSFKNSLSNIGRKSSVGSLTRRDSSPSGSSTPTKLFRKWFP